MKEHESTVEKFLNGCKQNLAAFFWLQPECSQNSAKKKSVQVLTFVIYFIFLSRLSVIMRLRISFKYWFNALIYPILFSSDCSVSFLFLMLIWFIWICEQQFAHRHCRTRLRIIYEMLTMNVTVKDLNSGVHFGCSTMRVRFISNFTTTTSISIQVPYTDIISIHFTTHWCSNSISGPLLAGNRMERRVSKLCDSAQCHDEWWTRLQESVQTEMSGPALLYRDGTSRLIPISGLGIPRCRCRLQFFIAKLLII